MTHVRTLAGRTVMHPDAIRAVDHLDDDTTLIVGVLTFAGTGWHTTGDALLANTAAALTRERRATSREELAHELGTTLAAGTLPAAASATHVP